MQDKQEHAEKKAVDLGNELKRVLKEKDDLEQRNKQLECNLQQVRLQAASKPPVRYKSQSSDRGVRRTFNSLSDSAIAI